MTAAVHRRGLLAVASALLLVVVFVADLLWADTHLGLGHFFYLPIVLAALAAGPRGGAIGGATAVLLYALATVLARNVSHGVLTGAMSVRVVTFVGVGVLIGWYAQTHRKLVAELQVLAQRDVLTGLPSTRAFETAITRRLEAGRPFALVLGDMDGLMQLNHELGHAHGNDALRALADGLLRALGPENEIARVGGDEFAVLAGTQTAEEARQLATRLEQLAPGETPVTFGWSSFPQDGENALSLFRAADERLYARKLVRGRRLGNDAVRLRSVRAAAAPTEKG